MTTTTRPPTLLWLIGLDHESGMRHGGNLRWFNLSRELLARGCRVYFGINRGPESDLAARCRYLEDLQRDGFISGHFVFDYVYPRWRIRAAGILGGHPAVLNRLLRGPQGSATRAISETSVEHDIDAIIVSDRSFLFLTESLRHRCPVFCRLGRLVCPLSSPGASPRPTSGPAEECSVAVSQPNRLLSSRALLWRSSGRELPRLAGGQALSRCDKPKRRNATTLCSTASAS